ncbi:MAG: hypothetical protein AAGJ73_08190 [Pseudomonadota bacterium]
MVFIEPSTGPLVAVAIELPIILLAAWSVCGWVFHVVAPRPALADRLIMGLAAFCFLMAAEIGLSVFVFSQSLEDLYTDWREAPGLLGLFGQFLFALFPLVRPVGDHNRANQT